MIIGPYTALKAKDDNMLDSLPIQDGHPYTKIHPVSHVNSRKNIKNKKQRPQNVVSGPSN